MINFNPNCHKLCLGECNKVYVQMSDAYIAHYRYDCFLIDQITRKVLIFPFPLRKLSLLLYFYVQRNISGISNYNIVQELLQESVSHRAAV